MINRDMRKQRMTKEELVKKTKECVGIFIMILSTVYLFDYIYGIVYSEAIFYDLSMYLKNGFTTLLFLISLTLSIGFTTTLLTTLGVSKMVKVKSKETKNETINTLVY